MGSRLRSIAPLLSPLVLLLAGVQLGCYKPNINDGGLKCNQVAGAKACPEGFTCDLATQRCYSPDAAIDRPAIDTGTDVDTGPEVEPDAGCPDATKPACTPGPGTCDPFCQTGCDCKEKCSVNTRGVLTCNQPAPGQQRSLLQPCQIQSAGMTSQIDQCAPGLVCVEDSCGGGGGAGRCYQFCRNDNECANAPCNRDIGGGFKVCDVPYDDCVPLAAMANTGCPGMALGCWLSTTDPSRTICDCQFAPGLSEGDLCTRSRECYPGLVCVDPNGQGFKQCARVCRLAVPTDCIGTCRTYMEGTISNPTYGFCR